LYVAIAKKLSTAENINIVFVTQHKKETDFIKKIIKNANVYEIEDFIRKNWNTKSEKDTKEVMKDYNNINIWRMLYTDRFLVNYNKEDCIKMINLHFNFFDELFKNERPKYFINEVVAIFAAYVAMVVGEKYDCTYVGTTIARDNAKNQFFFVDDLYQRNKEMERLYRDGEFDQSDIIEATDYLYEFRNQPKSPAYMNQHKRRPSFTLKLPLYPIKYLLEKNKKIYRDKVAYMTYNNAFKIINAPLINYIRYKCSVKYYRKPVEGEDYYLYTLHYQPEASTLVCAQKYEKQLLAIDNIAKSIPTDSVLYVKEHYAVLGHRDLHFYKELLKYPNVRLIDPYYDIHSLINNSLAVIVLTNTTGFEAILHGKKVFVLGEVFYDFFDNVEKITDIYNEHLKLTHIEPNASDDKIIRFLCAYKKSLYKGCVYTAFKDFLKEENIDVLISSFKDYIRQRT
ncbi:MAG: capsular polysaccharide export protein, LipB/KpsS family, partial [Mobilitalea sp.]